MSPVRLTFGTSRKSLLYGLAFLLASAPAARGQADRLLSLSQEGSGPPPAYIALVDGAATVQRDGQLQAATPNVPFVPGDRVRTSTGRVEVIFPDGSALDVDRYSGIDLQSPTLMRLPSGRVILVVAGAGDPDSAVRYQIDTPAASARTDGAGEYRIAVLSGRSGLETELAVLRGSAALATENGSMPIRAGERTIARENEAPAFPQAFNSARLDEFDRWSAGQQNARAGADSSQYLPQDLQIYGGTLDRYGSWQYTAPYGYAWYPTVAPDWRPYYDGYWAASRPWGWTWIGVDAWAWPTHHYGRWGYARDRWFWMPGRTWGAAWVTWASAPGFVSWCPLGFDERPVFGLSAGFENAWAGWTVVPRSAFGYASRVDRVALPPHSMTVPITAFVTHHRSPVDVPITAHPVAASHAAGAGVAVPRGVAPHELKQPLPDRFPAQGLGVSPANAAPPPVYPRTASPATAFPRTPPPATAYPRTADPANAAPVTVSPRNGYPVTPHASTAPQATLRTYLPSSEGAQRVSPGTAPAPPARIEHQPAPPSPAAHASSGGSTPHSSGTSPSGTSSSGTSHSGTSRSGGSPGGGRGR